MELTKKDILSKLIKVELFSNLEESELEHIANVVEVLFVEKGKNIIIEGENGSEMFILYSGEVEIKKKTMHYDEEYTVVKLAGNSNAFFGEIALIDHDSRSATVTADTDIVLLEIKRVTFDSLCNDYPSIGLKIYHKISKILSQRLRKANQDIITLFEALVLQIRDKG